MLTDYFKQICGLRNCEELDLSQNEITELPEEIDLMKTLTSLDVSQNKLKYIPDAIGEICYYVY